MELLDYTGSSLLILIFFLVFVVVAVLFLLSQYNTLKAIQPQNRTMSPGQVWLHLIPLFNLIWQFIVVQRISDSIRLELSSNTFSFEGEQPLQTYQYMKPTYQTGMTMCVLNVFGFIPILGSVARLAALVFWIVYWVQLVNFKNKILAKNFSNSSATNFN